MTLRIISGRQEPAPGTKRARNMDDVKAWLQAHPKQGKRADLIAADLGLPEMRVRDALLDLHLFDPMVVAIASPKGGYVVQAGWDNTARKGESNQARHNATRLERQAHRLNKASGATTNPIEAAYLASQVINLGAAAGHERLLAETLDDIVVMTPADD